MVEKRTTNRNRVFKAGTIEFGGSAIDCTIRNVSKYGAALDVASPVGIPEKFTLALPSDGPTFFVSSLLAQTTPDRRGV
jgi:hypothetical protein